MHHQSLDIYVDESSQNAHHYMVLGAVLARTSSVADLSEIIRASNQGSHEPLKWTRLTRFREARYASFIDTIFDLIGENRVHFHAMIVDTSKFDHRTYNVGRREVGFSKMIYQLLLHRGGLKYKSNLYVYLDYRSTDQTPEHLKLALDNGMMAKGRASNFRKVVFRNYSRTPLLWIADVLAGAIAFHKNRHHLRDNAAAQKVKAAARIAESAGNSDQWEDTGRNERFTVWNFRLRQSALGPR